MNNDKTFEDLIELMLSQAKRFLEELGEFFPYASVLDSQKQLSTLGIYDDKTDFDANKAIEIFEGEIKKRIDNGEILLGAIGINGFVRAENKNVILLKVTNDGIEWHDRDFTYDIENGKVQIEKYIG